MGSGGLFGTGFGQGQQKLGYLPYAYSDFLFSTIGEECRLRKVVIDKGCDIPKGTVVGEDRAQDFKRFYITDSGVVVVTPEMLGQEVHHVR